MLVTSLFLFAIWGDNVSDPCPAWSTPTCRLVFDDSYTSADIVLIGMDAWVYDADDANIVIDRIELRNPEGFVSEPDRRIPNLQVFNIFVHDLLSRLQNNKTYFVKVRVLDYDGKISGWSNRLYFRKAWVEMPAAKLEGLERR